MRHGFFPALLLALAACHEGSAPDALHMRTVVTSPSYPTACGAREDAALQCWGEVPPELFAPATRTSTPVQSTPVQQVTQPQLVQLSLGWYYSEHQCGLDRDGRAWCWGANILGQAGRPVSDAVSFGAVETQVRFRRLAVGEQHTCGVSLQGELYCWGEASLLGDAAGAAPICEESFGLRCWSTPVRIPLPEPVEEVVSGHQRICVLASSGTAWCWGDNVLDFEGTTPTYGSLGVGDDTSSVVVAPAPVTGGLRFSAIAMSQYGQMICGLVPGDAPYCWGRFIFGPFGDGRQPLDRSFTAPTRLPMPAEARLTSFSLGAAHGCGLDAEGVAWCWGSGLLGDGGGSEDGDAVRVVGGLRFSVIGAGLGFTCGIAEDGAWCWGSNSKGQVGNGSTTSQPIPVRVLRQGD